jgi:hypothetical protein
MGMTFNGKPFDPKDFTESLMKSLMEKAAEQIRDKVCAIRHPETGEFPTVVFSGSTLDNMSYKIEGSPELLALVHERLNLTTVDNSAPEAKTPYVVTSPPIAFLSYAWEDRELAGQIAHLLQGLGVETWWAEWCLKAGDSLRQKIDEGLGTCTHFIVLLTPNSLTKPWVNQEMDAGLMLKLQSKVIFIPLRHQLEVKELPPLLQGMLSPVVTDPDKDVAQLVNDIYGVTKKPVLGQAPTVATEIKTSTDSGFSPAANAVAKVFVVRTKCARKFDPWLEINDLVAATGLSDEDVQDAVHELHGMVHADHYGRVHPEAELFVTFDRFSMPWDPREDALKLAVDMQNSADFPEDPNAIAEIYGWEARRLNPAMAYLINRKLVKERSHLCMGDWLAASIERTPATRRFVKSRS